MTFSSHARDKQNHSPNRKASPCAFPAKATDQAQYGRFSAETDIVNATIALNCQYDERLAIKVFPGLFRQRSTVVEKRFGQVRVPQEVVRPLLSVVADLFALLG